MRFCKWRYTNLYYYYYYQSPESRLSSSPSVQSATIQPRAPVTLSGQDSSDSK